MGQGQDLFTLVSSGPAVVPGTKYVFDEDLLDGLIEGWRKFFEFFMLGTPWSFECYFHPGKEMG